MLSLGNGKENDNVTVNIIYYKKRWEVSLLGGKSVCIPVSSSLLGLVSPLARLLPCSLATTVDLVYGEFTVPANVDFLKP